MADKHMRVLVCGGRDYGDEAAVINYLFWLEDQHGDFAVVIHGGAPGADTHAGKFAQLRQAREVVYRANWRRFGKRAGPLRNQRMVDEGKPDLVVAFPGGRGTADMVRRAREAGIKVHELKATLSSGIDGPLSG